MKKLGYFTTFIVCILLFLQNMGAQTSMKNSVIGIQYVGPSDKPVTPIVIAESWEDADLFKRIILKLSDLEMTDMHVVSSPLMDELVATVEKGVENGKKSQATTSVVITVVTHGNTIEFHFNRRDAIKTLERLNEISKGTPALASDITHFQTRISP